MYKILLTTICLFPFLSKSQILHSKVKRELRKEVKSMFSEDQKFRAQLNKAQNQDSLWKLQSIIDSTNKIKLIQIIEAHGYPSRKRINGGEYSTILVLHLTLEKDFIELQEIFKTQLENGNMPPRDYALWYDRSLINQKLESYFGEYGRKSFCDEELEGINNHRLAIGLLKLEKGEQCK